MVREGSNRKIKLTSAFGCHKNKKLVKLKMSTNESDGLQQLSEKIENKEYGVGIVGLGYVFSLIWTF